MSLPDPFIEPSSRHRGRVIAGIFATNLLWVYLALSQRSQGIFGPCFETPLSSPPAGLLIEPHKGGRPGIVLLTEKPPRLTSYTVAGDGSLREQESSPLVSKCHFWMVADLSGEAGGTYLGLTRAGDSLVVARRRGKGAFVERSIPLEVRPQKMILADIDNDHQKEILLFGKSMAGVQVLNVGPDLAVSPGPLLFQDVSAADLAVADLNGDGIADVFLADWLSNKVDLFFGISKTFFSEQLTIDLAGEPSSISLTPVSRKRTMLLAVTLPGQNRIAVFSGNGAGEFRRTATIRCQIPPAAASFVNLNGDSWPDVVATSERGVLTINGRSSTEFETPVVYGCGNVVNLCQALDLNGDGQVDLVCADRNENRLLVAMRSVPRGADSDRSLYLTGELPTGVVVADVNSDGHPDILVANSGSSSLSLLMGKERGSYWPAAMISTQESPTDVRTAEGDPQTIIVTHAGAEKISVVNIADLARPVSFAIPTARDPAVLVGIRKAADRGLRILVRSLGGRQESSSFSVFEQLSGKSFLEKSFEAYLPTAIRSLTTTNISGTISPDLVVMWHEKSTRRTNLSYAAADQDLSYNSTRLLLSIPDTSLSFRSVQADDVDRDGLDDFLLVAGQPRNAMGIAYSSSPGFVDSTLRWLTGGIPRQGSSVIVDDLDGDGNRDIAFLDQDSRTVKVIYGSGGRRFTSAVSVASAEDVGDFAIASIRFPGEKDLVMTHRKKGYVSIQFAPFAR